MDTRQNLSFKITFRNFKSSQSLLEYVEKRLAPIFKRFYDRDLTIHVTFSKRTLCFGEVNVHFPNFTLVASTEDKDFYQLVDKLKDIVREQLRRHKEKLLGR
ncbi:MAG: ribosome-associated translation inhibitor RaiA [Deltaproteobacteria bacterium]|nr:ribosome-associated translation inhibitor RaiA [Deltaproteobacteria bacterium]MCX7953344.1 ribosome-associated translation inhibitor RaiA [Deltaproteobacteria bacterium]